MSTNRKPASRVFFIIGALLLAWTMTGCGGATPTASDQAATSSTPNAMTNTNNNNNNAALAVTPLSATLLPNATQQFLASGGMPPYRFNASGGGTIDANGNFTAPAIAATVTIQVQDASGATVQAVAYVSNQNNNTNTPTVLTLSPATVTVNIYETQTFTATGGTAPYTFSVISGGGSFNGNIYTASSAAGSALIQVKDAAGNTKTATVTIQSTFLNTVLNQSVSVLVDHYLGFTYDDATSNKPTLVFFGTGPTVSDPASLAKNADFCDNYNGDIYSPCAVSVQLTNYDSTRTNVYRGTLVISSRDATVQYEFCIQPTQVNKMLIHRESSSYVNQAIRYNYPGKILLSGRLLVGEYSAVDTEPGVGYANVSIQNAGYSATDTNCGTGYDLNTFVQAYSF